MGGRVYAEREGAIGWLVFDHPERRNAISVEMWEAIPELARRFDADPEVAVIVMRGAGDVAFVSGADISEFERERTGANVAAYEGNCDLAFGTLGRLGKPLVAMVHGFCVGGGMGIALKADLRYTDEEAQFGIPAAKLGLGYGADGIATLVDLVGPSVAKEMIFTARRLRAPEALRVGLANAVFPKAELEARVREIAVAIAANGADAIADKRRLARSRG